MASKRQTVKLSALNAENDSVREHMPTDLHPTSVDGGPFQGDAIPLTPNRISRRVLRRLPLAVRRQLWPILVVCLAIAAGGALLSPSRMTMPCRLERLDALTVERVELIRHDPKLVTAVFAECEDELKRNLFDSFSDLTDEDRQLVFCTIVANAMAPYGPSDSLTLDGLLASPYLNCGSYPVLMARLYQFFGPSEHPPHLLGWDGGFMGPHGMIYRPHPDVNHCMFLDPTIAMVARATFDHVTSGKPVKPERLVSFNTRQEMVRFQRHVARGFVKGSFRPSDLLYYFAGIEHYDLRSGQPTDWPTPGAMALRKREGR